MEAVAEPNESATESAGVGRKVMLMAGLVFAAVSLLAGMPSDAFLEADACTHYLYSRFAFQEPVRWVDVWGRPVCTAAYAVPAAALGRTGSKLMCLALALGVAWTAAMIARRLGVRRPELAFIAVLGQPLVFMHSFTEMTELPFALLLGLAMVCYIDRRWALLAITAGLTPLARPEGFAVMPLAVAALALHRRWWAIPLALLPLVAWNHAGWELWGRSMPWWRWLPSQWPYAQQSLYPAGPWWWFLGNLPVIVGPLLLPALLGGTWSQASRAASDTRGHGPAGAGGGPGLLAGLAVDHLLRCRWIVLLLPWAVLAGHSLLHATGRMASNGEPRYLLVVAPFWGYLAAVGLERATDALRIARPAAVAGVLAASALLTHLVYPVFPLATNPDWQALTAITGWMKAGQNATGLTHVMASHPAAYYLLDVSPIDGSRVRVWSRQNLLDPPPSTLLIWDAVYGTYNSDRNLVVTLEDLHAAGWIPLEEPQRLGREAWGNRPDYPPNIHVFRSPDGSTGGP